MAAATVKLSDYVIRFIADLGVKHVFMLPGGGAMHLDDSLGRCQEIEYICNLHEQACAISAEAYGRATNHLGVAVVTSGPGGTNALTGVAGAWLASTPCLIISGQVKCADMKGSTGVRQRGPQEVDIVSMVAPITKYAVTVIDPQTIRYHMEKAVALATSGRKGPVWIDLPLDVQATQICPEHLLGYGPEGRFDLSLSPADLSRRVADAIRILNEAERPVILVGNGVHHAGARSDFAELVEMLGIPVLTTWAASDLLPGTHPLFVGKPGTIASRAANFALQNSDCLLSIGARLDFDVTGFDQSKFARAARKVVVDVDPAEIKKLQMDVHVPVCADARDFIRELLRQRQNVPSLDCRPWRDLCESWKQRYPVVLPEYWDQKEYVNTYVFATVLCEEMLGDDLVVPGSSGAGLDMFWMAYHAKPGQRAFSTGGLGAMGFGIPGSIGGCLAVGRKRTISVDGDGGFHMNIQELETVARLNLPIKYFVLNNQGYASIRTMQRNHFRGNLVGCDATCGLSLPDTVKVATAFGVTTKRIHDQTRLRESIREVLETPGPIVCDVMIDPQLVTSPRASSAVRPDGSMVSKPLEDLWPFLDRREFVSNMIIPPVDE
ncbi:MAG: thiamine pyrophosphate-binding protein [Planctomycetota bacterium]|nr:thiamine pyrophosphate-binding protein [Planctomycetota bacterium]